MSLSISFLNFELFKLAGYDTFKLYIDDYRAYFSYLKLLVIVKITMSNFQLVQIY